MERLANIHPGEILMDEFLKPLNIMNRVIMYKLSLPAYQASGMRGLI